MVNASRQNKTQSNIGRIILPGIILNILLFLNNDLIRAQERDPSGVRITLEVNDVSLSKILQLIEQQTIYKFAYKTDLISEQKTRSLKVHEIPLNELLSEVFNGTNISFSIIDNQIVLQEKDPLKTITISGFVKDSISGESLTGALVYIPSLNSGTYSNNYSFYSISLNETDSLDVIVHYLGYKEVRKVLNVHKDLTANFTMSQSYSKLEQIIITRDKKDDNLKMYHAGKSEIPSDLIRKIPSLISNGDLINSVLMLPGIIGGVDGTPGYFVRGGNSDQNMVLLDEATLYNPSHLFGLVSIFNTAAINSSSFYKAAFPANYGGNLSSVLDVTMLDGNKQQFSGELSAGTISSGVTLNGPIKSGRSSFLLSARRSTIDLLLKPLNLQNYYSNYYFYDINSKLNFLLSDKDRIFFSLYAGNDKSSYSSSANVADGINYNINFGNQAMTFRWNHLFSPKLFSNTSLIYNNYYQSLNATQSQYFASMYSGIRDINGKYDIYYYPNPVHKINAGISYLYQTLIPAFVSDKIITNGSVINIIPSNVPEKFTNLAALYLSDDIIIKEKFNIYGGVRIPLFYNDDSQYLNIEPRLSVIYMLNPSSSLKVSYTSMHQYDHLMQSFNATFPAELWIGSSKKVKPESSQQVTAGIYKNFKDNIFQSGIELYYKKMDNLMLFRGGIQPTITGNMENSLVFGEGKSYGAEFFFRKTTGRMTGWIAYSYSFAYQQFDSLNLGKQFPFSNDRRHALYFLESYAINKHWEISSNFLYTSGRAITLSRIVTTPNPDSNPLFDDGHKGSNSGSSGGSSSGSSGSGSGSTSGSSGSGNGSSGGSSSGSNSGGGSTSGSDGGTDGGSINDPGSFSQVLQNNFRLTPYNRLDISIRYHSTRVLPKRITETEWSFSVYNVYARHNTYFVYRSIDPVTKQPVANQVSFVPVILSLSYSYRF